MATGLQESWTGRALLITQRLRLRRSDLGLTQKQVVTRLARQGVHTTNRALSSLEHGAGLDVAKLPELADALDCTVTYLVGLTDDPRRWEPDHRLDDQDMAPSGTAARSGAAGGSAPRTRHSFILGADVPDRGSRLGTGGHDHRS